jgi:hypothetical protein
MFEIWIIQDLKDSWQVATSLFTILQEEDGQEDVVYVDTDYSNASLIRSLGVSADKAIVFLKPLPGGKAVIIDRMEGNTSDSDLRRRYRAAKRSPLVIGSADGVPAGDIIDLDPRKGNADRNNMLALGFLPFATKWPWWVWMAIGGFSIFQGIKSRHNSLVWYGTGGLATIHSIQLKTRSNEEL